MGDKGKSVDFGFGVYFNPFGAVRLWVNLFELLILHLPGQLDNYLFPGSHRRKWGSFSHHSGWAPEHWGAHPNLRGLLWPLGDKVWGFLEKSVQELGNTGQACGSHRLWLRERVPGARVAMTAGVTITWGAGTVRHFIFAKPYDLGAVAPFCRTLSHTLA